MPHTAYHQIVPVRKLLRLAGAGLLLVAFWLINVGSAG